MSPRGRAQHSTHPESRMTGLLQLVELVLNLVGLVKQGFLM
jgi:hypothetical protein